MAGALPEWEPMVERVNNLSRGDLRQYWASAIPCPLDFEIAAVADAYAAADSEERKAMRGRIQPGRPWAFLGFAERMAALAVRERKEERIAQGLLGMVLEGFRHDPRENILVLSLLHHSAEKLGADARALFERAAALADESAARHLRDFVNRSPELKRIEVMGFREKVTKQGFAYERT